MNFPSLYANSINMYQYMHGLKNSKTNVRIFIFNGFRFESTIAGQFFGHTHDDKFQVFFDDQNRTRATKYIILLYNLWTCNRIFRDLVKAGWPLPFPFEYSLMWLKDLLYDLLPPCCRFTLTKITFSVPVLN